MSYIRLIEATEADDSIADQPDLATYYRRDSHDHRYTRHDPTYPRRLHNV